MLFGVLMTALTVHQIHRQRRRPSQPVFPMGICTLLLHAVLGTPLPTASVRHRHAPPATILGLSLLTQILVPAHLDTMRWTVAAMTHLEVVAAEAANVATGAIGGIPAIAVLVMPGAGADLGCAR